MNTQGRWGVAVFEEDLATALDESPDGLIHARPGHSLDQSVEPFCVTGGDRDLTDGVHVSLSLGHPGADPSVVTCPDCLGWMHA